MFRNYVYMSSIYSHLVSHYLTIFLYFDFIYSNVFADLNAVEPNYFLSLLDHTLLLYRIREHGTDVILQHSMKTSTVLWPNTTFTIVSSLSSTRRILRSSQKQLHYYFRIFFITRRSVCTQIAEQWKSIGSTKDLYNSVKIAQDIPPAAMNFAVSILMALLNNLANSVTANVRSGCSSCLQSFTFVLAHFHYR